MEKVSIKIEAKSYDISIHESMHDAVLFALNQLGKDNISAKQLLEAYISKVIECEKLQNELDLIDRAIEELDS